MEFLSDQYKVAEHNRSISVPVYRYGDVSYQSSVICYTRQHSAQVMMDYEERLLSESSRIVFEPGDRVGARKGYMRRLRRNQQSECAPIEDSDQPGHPPSLIGVFAVRSMC